LPQLRSEGGEPSAPATPGLLLPSYTTPWDAAAAGCGDHSFDQPVPLGGALTDAVLGSQRSKAAVLVEILTDQVFPTERCQVGIKVWIHGV
jgi:hypothetical protein